MGLSARYSQITSLANDDVFYAQRGADGTPSDGYVRYDVLAQHLGGRELHSVSVSAWDNDNPVDGAFGTSTTEIDITGAVLSIPSWYDGSPFYVQCRFPANHTVASRAFTLYLKEGATYLDSMQGALLFASFRTDFNFVFPPITLSAGAHTLKFAFKTYTSGVIYMVNAVDIFHARANLK